MKRWVIFGLALALYFVSLFGGFIQDDVKVIQKDSGMGKVSALMSAWTRPYYYMDGNEFSVYRPVTSFSFYFNALITGKEAWGFRLGNVLIYGWVCVMVYEVLKKLKNSKTQKLKVERVSEVRLPHHDYVVRNDGWRDGAFWGAVVFVVLPIHTEVVNNIVGRAEMLALGCVLFSILKAFDKKWELVALFLLLGMLSKETAVVGVPIVWYLIWVQERIDKREKVGAGFLVMMSLVGFLLLRMVILGGAGTVNKATMVENPLKFVSAEKRVMNAIALVPFGVGKIIFPVNLSYDYSYNQIILVDTWLDWRVVMGIVMALLSGVYLYRLPHQPRRVRNDESYGIDLQVQALKVVSKNPPQSLFEERGRVLMTMGMMLFWGPIFLTGNILFPIGTIFGERLWFWPSLGVVMVLMYIGSKTAKNRAPALLSRPVNTQGPLRLVCTWSARLFGYSSAPILITVLCFFVGRTVVRNFDWLSQERLFLHDAKYVTGSVMAQSNAAAMYLIGRDLEKAKPMMERASEIYPKYPELLNNWGLYYQWIGKKEEAKRKFEECLEERPGFYLCEGNLKGVK